MNFFGLSNDLVVPGDYDGDGKTDFAVVREGSTPTDPLTWYIQKSTDGNLLAYQFGLTGTDLIAQGDYDGDGKTDVGVWRDSNGQFFALQSGSGLSLLTRTWGISNDFPAASYDTH